MAMTKLAVRGTKKRLAVVKQPEVATLTAAYVWTPFDVEHLILCSAVSLSLVMYVSGVIFLVKAGVVSATVPGAASGAGMVGIGTLIYKLFKMVIRRNGRRD
jgi:hypothetical protein